MEISVDIDDELLARAQEITGIVGINELARLALEELIRVEKARRENLQDFDFSGQSG
jgi:Arc/MetJ family transcription regulator